MFKKQLTSWEAGMEMSAEGTNLKLKELENRVMYLTQIVDECESTLIKLQKHWLLGFFIRGVVFKHAQNIKK